MLPQVFVTGLALAQAAPSIPAASCRVLPKSVVGRSAAGVAQVSNLALIQLEAGVPARPMPASGVQHGLKADVTVYQVSETGTRTMVPSSINVSGGGTDATTDVVWFYLDLPLDDAERDGATREYLTQLARRASESSDARERSLAARIAEMKPEAFANLFRQHRAGSFRVECRVLDGDRVLGTSELALEVLFKGRFFEQDAFQKH